VASIALEPGRQDVVRVMNLHKAKGLEAPVVFLADPVTGGSDRVSVRVVREGRHAYGFFRIVRRNPRRWSETLLAEPADWDAHEQAESSFLSAEATRLLYVAATRAAELLVVSRWAAGKGAQPWAAFDPHLARARELAIPAHVPVPARALGDLGPAARETAARQREAAHAAVSRASWRVESVTATTHKAGPVGRPLQAGRTREPDTGVAWGTLVHGLLEAAMRGPHRDRAHLERVARWLTMDNAELRRVVPEALDTVERVMASEFWQRAIEAEERQVEMPCAVRIDGRVLFGVMDLAFRDAAGWHVIDYKTDQATMRQLVERYGEQVAAYADVLARLARSPVAFAGLYSVREQLSDDLNTTRRSSSNHP
jgi:ATP-dependent helicase/nuclease subunit A